MTTQKPGLDLPDEDLTNGRDSSTTLNFVDRLYPDNTPILLTIGGSKQVSSFEADSDYLHKTNPNFVPRKKGAGKSREA
ncbi:hypothetical protein CDL15_Pgr013934 [Punica granatum]|uniref:Uncharacterized protein n=1 Tax=Punica granatum TaxID=22663 RepID=A0A218WAB9_PUNGR|nr:hypothetical protein CDL15_Pgr013934 [Punica granatum]